ncbi:unnamed protein product [Allacma fusca]|uniref:C3H1-type domain-containing protein n=1 Tax=Allacma fusca TaxID=39272 RepID=A0A8J2PB25_9HEXA|nr:unnamed protein product [Allacma fusca]
METRVTPLRLDREDEKKMLPCRFFANGYCHKGNRCRFYHPLNTALNSIIRVPPLPPHFGGPAQDIGRQSQQPPQQTPQPSRIPPLFPTTPPMNGVQRGMPPQINGMMNGPPQSMNNYNYCPSPPSPPPFMDYATAANQSSPFMFDAPVGSPQQNTVFNHIDWSEFLAPGQAPPPPTQVPDERQERLRLASVASAMLSSEPPSSSSSNEDMPPEGRTQRKLTAKEELQMKVKEIAKELAEEPITPIHSLDSFFRNFTFNGYSSVGSKLKNHALADEQLGEKNKASGDSTQIGGPTVSNTSDRLTVRDMADALMEIYIANYSLKGAKPRRNARVIARHIDSIL